MSKPPDDNIYFFKIYFYRLIGQLVMAMDSMPAISTILKVD